MAMSVRLSPEQFHDLRAHLFAGKVEQAGFGYGLWTPHSSGGEFAISSIELIAPEDLAFQSGYHIELGREAQARIIKTAFTKREGLVEFHSHRTAQPACFSPSDFRGFEEFVPHVRWRLAGRPYAAIVFHMSSVDGLVWLDDKPVQLDHIHSSATESEPATGLSLQRSWEVYDS